MKHTWIMRVAAGIVALALSAGVARADTCPFPQPPPAPPHNEHKTELVCRKMMGAPHEGARFRADWQWMTAKQWEQEHKRNPLSFRYDGSYLTSVCGYSVMLPAFWRDGEVH